MLHHLEIGVSDLENSLRFWTPFLRQLGYEESQRWSGGVSYRSGPTCLCFVQTPGEHLAAGFHRRRIGLNHLAFRGESRAHVDELARWVESAGYATLYADRYPHAGGSDHYALYCEDPDRIKVEVVAPA
ncbi:VOC family protein [Roseateles chitinivorans]|uniref:VOC family protein n=1 Tax=Roseateles chitinivorans TaxID=2917965 RepID=UPI003D6796B2